jgi:hypothetical protein
MRKAGGHSAKRCETLGLLARAALLSESGAGVEIRSGELADLVEALGFGRRLGAFICNAREALRERAERTHDAAREHPRKRERKQPERSERGESPRAPKLTRRRPHAEKEDAPFAIERHAHGLAARA